MSKERELLWRWHNGDLLPEEYMRLMKETKELLAQPEQEPMACKIIVYSTRAEQVAFEEGIIFAKILYGIGVDYE